MKASVSTLALVATSAVVWLAATTVNQAAQNKAAAAAPGGSTRLAVVDIVRVFDTFEQTVVLNKKLDAHTKLLGEEAEKRGKEVQAEQEALQAFAPDSADWYKQNEKVKKMVFENEVWRQLERDGIAESHKRWVLRTYQMMTAEIEKVAKAHGVDIVLTREKLKGDVGDSKAVLAQILNIKVVYASSDPSIDLTDEVLANLNGEFAKRGGAAAIEFSK
jgi:Skp family chaperone for outer membrane proteins